MIYAGHMTTRIPTVIVDKNGKQTTVHRNPEKKTLRSLFSFAQPQRVPDRPANVGMTVFSETLKKGENGEYIYDPNLTQIVYNDDIMPMLDVYQLDAVREMAESQTQRKYLYHTMMDLGDRSLTGMHFSIEFDPISLDEYIHNREANGQDDAIASWREFALPHIESALRLSLRELDSKLVPDKDYVKRVVDLLSDTTLDDKPNNGRYEAVRDLSAEKYSKAFSTEFTVQRLFGLFGLAAEVTR